eukprot:g9169.t1
METGQGNGERGGTPQAGREGKAKTKARRNESKKRRKAGPPREGHDHGRQQCGGMDIPGEKAVVEAAGTGGGGGGGAAAPGKKRRRQDAPAVHAQGVSKQHPFPTEYGDHFETPLQAYRDIEGPLELLSKLLGKKKRKHLRIWDPYYCAGRTPRLLRQLGFPKVEHSNQDFYKLVRENQQPKHDVLVTNPPYSGDHKKRCLEYCRASGKPWFLLVPNYVATKDYYRLAVLGPAAGPGGEPFYVVPDSKYSFDHPEGTGHADSPFSGVWYVHCGSHTEAVFQGAAAERRGGVSVLRSLDDLSQTGAVTTARRLNPRQRKALKKKRSAGASAGL